MARIKKTRFRHSALISAVTMAAPALAATAILSAQSTSSTQSASPALAAVTLTTTAQAAPTTAAPFAALAPATAGGEPLVLGAQTHFSQNWSGTANDLASQAKAPCCAIRCPGRRARPPRAATISTPRRPATSPMPAPPGAA
jgi:hypothetical protein